MAWLGHMLDDQAAVGEGVEQFWQRMVAHADTPADVVAPPRGFFVPSGQPVDEMGENPAVVPSVSPIFPKGALVTFTRGLSIEVASEGIRSNSVSPGAIESAMSASTPEVRDFTVQQSPLGRIGQP